jgi:acetyl-CoA carboxylase carboxyl transferase subunit alpha
LLYFENYKGIKSKRVMQHYLEFEKELATLEGKATELRSSNASKSNPNESKEAESLEKKATKLLKELYSDLTPWHKCQIARHPERPHASTYIHKLMSEFTPLLGDRKFAEDKAIIGGLARLNDLPLVVIGHEKGNDTKSRIEHNFGMARPEGYRKAVRLMDLADRFELPVITLIDTPGAYPGKGAEERGQAEAIASAIEKCLKIKVPLISIIIGEGGSGGAVALASSNKVIMLEHSIYSVISPEGCASILWKSSDKMREAAEALKLTSQDLSKLGVIDEIISEPIGGAHRNVDEIIPKVGKAIERSLKKYQRQSPDEILKERRNKFLSVGQFSL